MNVNRQDDQTLWFRNLPPKENDEGSEEVQDSAGKEPEITKCPKLTLDKRAVNPPL